MSIDLKFRPESYGEFDDPVRLAVNGIKGTMRREMVRDMLTAEGDQRALYDSVLGPIEERILGESAAEEDIQRMNRLFGPAWMGGEYLPDHEPGEMEIARLELDSVLGDVISVRARIAGGVYHYSVVDEYETPYVVPRPTSERTLTLEELAELIDGTRWEGDEDRPEPFVQQWWDRQVWDTRFPSERDLQKATDFCRVVSEQYPKLHAYYESRGMAWREQQVRSGLARRQELVAELPDVEVCGACGEAVGPFEQDGATLVQGGACALHSVPDPEPKWPRHDFNRHVEICRCCGREPLPSGSKYSVWFCDYCKRAVGLLNGRHGRCVVPIGRHSVHAGFMLRMEEQTTDADILLFTEALNSVAAVHGPLKEWAREAVRQNLRACGWEEDAVVPLPDYWEAVVRQGIHPEERFGQMRAFLADAGRRAAR